MDSIQQLLLDYSQRKRTPLYLSENSRTTLEQCESLTNNDDCFKQHNDDDSINQYQLQQFDYIQKKPFAMVRPQRILTCMNDKYRSFLSTLDLNSNVASRLRESKSLDIIIPSNQLRNRIDSKRLPLTKIDRSACSLDAGVSMISRDPMPEPFNLDNLRCNFEIGSSRMICTAENDSTISINKNAKKSKSPYKAQNNCNGPTTTMLAEDAHCPLLYRQNSLNNPQDENLLQQKRWRSLETVQVNRNSDSDTSAPKKTVNRGSIRSWLVNLFQGNGFNDASLRKTGVVPNRVKGFSGFGELPPAPEHESIV